MSSRVAKFDNCGSVSHIVTALSLVLLLYKVINQRVVFKLDPIPLGNHLCASPVNAFAKTTIMLLFRRSFFSLDLRAFGAVSF